MGIGCGGGSAGSKAGMEIVVQEPVVQELGASFASFPPL